MAEITCDKAWFEAQLTNDDFNAQEIATTLADAGGKEGSRDLLVEGLESWIGGFGEQKKYTQAVYALEWLLSVDTSVEVITRLKELFAEDRNLLKLIEPAGFSTAQPIARSFESLRYLCALEEGALTYHPSWGFGVVNEIDYFYGEVEVEFKQKGEHTLAFSHAIEALELLNDEHLLALHYKQPEKLEEMIKKEPQEVVRLALVSYGEMSVARLIERLVPAIIPEAGWKKFWDGARKKIKDDASIDIPKKRSELIRICKGMAYDESWFTHVREENDIERLFEKFKEILERKLDYSSAQTQEILANRLEFIIGGAPRSKPEWKAEGFIYGRLFNIEPTGLDSHKILHDLIEQDLSEVLERLPSRQLEILLSILLENDREAALQRLQRVIPHVGHPALNEIIQALLTHDAEEEIKKLMGAALSRRQASASMLLWAQRSPEKLAAWNLISKSDLAFRIQEVLEKNLSGALLRAQNQLRDRFQEEKWLYEVMDEMSEQQRRDFMRRIFEGQGWEALDRKSLMAKVLKKYPQLQDIVTPVGKEAPKKEIPYTSARSYRERQAQLEKLMKVDIPENSKEIEVARSYGDLRENAEFKYAKERQALLMAQGAQLAEDLERVKPTDFADSQTDVVNSGTGVHLEMEEGEKKQYYILGAWDQDDALAIISSETALAKALMGAKAGDQVTIPEGKATLVEILPLSAEVATWANA